MTIDDIIASLRHMEGELASLRAHVATLTAAPATTTEPGLDLDARVPCAFCGGDFVWTFPKDDDPWFAPVSARCRCGNEWNDVPAPVTWRTLATAADEVPAAYVARLVAEVDRLNALLTASTPSPAPADNSGADPARGEGVSEERRACWTCKWALSLSECDHPARGWPNQWIRENCDLGGLPNDNARNCPGWAPKSGEVSNG